MSPQTGSRRYTHTHLKWFMGTLVFSALHCRDFSFFYFLLFFVFFCGHKKHKNANQRISYFFPLRCFLSAFLIFVPLFPLFCFCLIAFLCFLCFCVFCVFGAFVALVLFGAYKIFSQKKKKKFETAVITSFILLLKLSYCKHEFFNHYNLFQLSQFFKL